MKCLVSDLDAETYAVLNDEVGAALIERVAAGEVEVFRFNETTENYELLTAEGKWVEVVQTYEAPELEDDEKNESEDEE